MAPSPNRPGSFQICTRLLLALFSLAAIACGLTVLRQGVAVDTNLKSLSPAIAHDQVINQTLDEMSRIAAGQFTLVLTHSDEAELENASDALRELVDEHAEVLHYADRTEVLSDYLAQLGRYPFSFLDDPAQAALQSHSDEHLLRTAVTRLYGSGGSVRLIPLQQDPFGFASDYSLQALAVLSGGAGDEIAATTIAGEEVFYIAHNLMLMSSGLDMGTQAEALARVRSIESEIKQQYPGTEFLHSGIFFFAADAAQNSKDDISLITTGSAIGVLLLVLLVFRSSKALLLPLVSIGLGLLFAFVVCQALFGSIHVFTLVFGASLIGVVIDYSLHFFYFHSHKIQDSDAHLYRALTLSLFTSVIGYSALSWSGLAALMQVALFSGLGLAFAWLVVVTLGPLLTRRITIHDRWLNNNVHCVLLAFAQIKTSVWAGGLLATGLMALLFSGFELAYDDSPRALFSPNPQLIQEEQIVTGLTNTNEPGSFMVIRGKSAQQVYDLIGQVEQQLPENSNRLVGVHRFFPSPQNFQQAYQLNQRLYGDGGLALRFMREQGFAPEAVTAMQESYAQGEPAWLSPAAFFARHASQLPPLWIEQDGVISTFLLIPKSVDLNLLRALATESDGVFYISAIEETTLALGDLRHSALWLLLVAFMLVALLMLLHFRSLRTSLAVLTAPACALLGTLIILALFNVPMTLFHVMALFLVLGLGMDYVIFVIEIEGSPEQTLSAIVLSAATSLLSFGLLAASDLPAVSGFGLTVLIGNSLNLFGGLVLASRKFKREPADPLTSAHQH